MTKTLHYFIVAFVLTLSESNAQVWAKEPVDLLLVLAADVSRSVDADKFKLQREGYADRDSRVINAITAAPADCGPLRRVVWCGLTARCDQLDAD